jgi:hypothetical protein
VVVGEELRGRCDDTGLVGARQEQDGGHDARSIGDAARSRRRRLRPPH